MVAARSDRGRTHGRNEDAVFVEPPDSNQARAYGWLGVVADGLGGRPAGNIASAEAVRTLREFFYTSVDEATAPADRLRHAMEQANAVVYAKAHESVAYTGMSTTVTAAVVQRERAMIAQVGDSRAYLLRDGVASRLTRDHSLVEELVNLGELTPEEARNHPRRNIVTRLIGAKERVEVDLVELRVRPGDVLLLCSDGLHGLLDDTELVIGAHEDPGAAADRLVELANARGGRDNISVVIARIETPAATEETRSSVLPARWAAVLGAIVVLVLTLVVALLTLGPLATSTGANATAVPTLRDLPSPSTVPTLPNP